MPQPGLTQRLLGGGREGQRPAPPRGAPPRGGQGQMGAAAACAAPPAPRRAVNAPSEPPEPPPFPHGREGQASATCTAPAWDHTERARGALPKPPRYSRKSFLLTLSPLVRV